MAKNRFRNRLLDHISFIYNYHYDEFGIKGAPIITPILIEVV